MQLPSSGNETAGQPQFIFPLARAGAAVGIDALFVEVHPDPAHALSDAASQMNLDLLDELLQQVTEIDKLVKSF